jgi:hypothetical protein
MTGRVAAGFHRVRGHLRALVPRASGPLLTIYANFAGPAAHGHAALFRAPWQS